jgi:hypothetical protein
MTSEAWSSHLFTADEHGAFERDGYLMLPGALTPDTVAALRAIAFGLDEEFRAQPSVGPYDVLNRHDVFAVDDAFFELIDQPTTFAKVCAILGWNIQLFHTQLIVTPPTHPDAPAGAYAWHQDNNRMNLDFETSPPHPRVSVKVGYFLTDLPAPGMGNLCVAPGTHVRGRPEAGDDAQPERVVEITASAGDAVLFDRRLWHAASTNRSSDTRVFLAYGYSYRWLRPKSTLGRQELFDRSDPIRRQLLGAAPTGANGYFDPQDEDVPLRAWMHEQHGAS